MYSFKSTEKSLAMLALKAKTRGFNKVAINKTGWSAPRAFVSQYRRGGNVIKTIQVNKEIPARVKAIAPLLNPAKPAPSKILSEPIKPLTLPRFPSRGNSEIPSVTKVLQATMPAASKFALDRWKETMIKKLGVAGFSQYQKDTFARGHALHSLLATHLLGGGEPTLSEELVSNLWKSIQKVVRDKITNVRLVEHIVTHPEMNYRGIIDCVAFYENELVVIDFKTAEKPKKTVESLYDNPLQVTAYCGAINSDKSIPNHVIDRNICAGVVIVAYVDGSDASTYYLDSEKVTNVYWNQWINRLDQYSRMEDMNKQLESKGLKKE